MRKSFKKLEKYRFTDAGIWASTRGDRFGAFRIPSPGPNARTIKGAVSQSAPSRKAEVLRIIADDGKQTGWEHVSVSLAARCPTWPEMQFVKRLFFEPEETVIQFHPPKSKYIDREPWFVLHLWRKIGETYELPPPELV